jgi:hypothetical protein
MVEYFASNSDLRWNKGLLISLSIVMNSGVLLHTYCMKPPGVLRKRNLNQSHPAFLCFMLDITHKDIG